MDTCVQHNIIIHQVDRERPRTFLRTTVRHANVYFNSQSTLTHRKIRVGRILFIYYIPKLFHCPLLLLLFRVLAYTHVSGSRSTVAVAAAWSRITLVC